MSEFAKDVQGSDFDQVVLEGSKQVPVLVDFWAPWCGPCRALTPTLDKLADEYQGKFMLVKVNSDENPDLSQRYNIRSIPNVKAFVDGELVDEFLGALPESAVREFIESVLPTPGELLRRDAAEKAHAGDIAAALETLAKATALEPRNDAIQVDRVALLFESGQVQEAREAAAQLSPLASQDTRARQVLARLHLADESEGADDENALEARVRSNPEDSAARLALAKLYVRQQRYEPALDHLLEITRRDRRFGDDIGRKSVLAIFDLLGGENEIVSRYRRQLAAALH
jgi:putative thioredoxin